MSIESAKEVLHSVDHEQFPPTNPSVLLEAARTIYLNQREEQWEGGAQFAIMRLLVHTLSVISGNLIQQPLPSDITDAIAHLEIFRSYIRSKDVNPFD